MPETEQRSAKQNKEVRSWCLLGGVRAGGATDPTHLQLSPFGREDVNTSLWEDKTAHLC